MRFFSFVSLCSLSLVFSLSSCSSSKSSSKKKSSEDTGPGFSERVSKWDMSKRSSFEKSTGKNGERGNKQFRSKNTSVRSKDYQGNTKFTSGKGEFKSGKDGFKTSEFSQSDKSNRMGNQEFSGADDQNRYGDTKFKTSDSRYNNTESRYGNQTSRMNDKDFRVPTDVETRNAMEKSKRPVIVDFQKPDYSESEVRNMLNKN